VNYYVNVRTDIIRIVKCLTLRVLSEDRAPLDCEITDSGSVGPVPPEPRLLVELPDRVEMCAESADVDFLGF
jgi:hypothetical protein